MVIFGKCFGVLRRIPLLEIPLEKNIVSGGTLKQLRLKKNTKITRPKTFLSNSNEKGQYFTFFSFVDKHTTKKEGKSTRRVSE